ncbi:MFS transporter [Streptomyces sp. AC555_RSS877]|uniref:MFS transporter n=1 Tax=Streptomyces sp. AC555_RSS877 TaxID=2823688 RepID=UPI001C2721DA|nr:MFS transporter [Streptomyces sp. AC555_RSS877]
MLKSLATRVATAVIPAGRAGRLLVAGALVDSFGSGLFGASSTLYFVSVLDFPASQVAVVLSVAALCGLLSPVPAGRLADRFGAVRVYIPLVLLRGVGYACYTVVDSVRSYAVLTCLLYAADRACSPLFQVIVAGACSDTDRTHALSSIRAVRNIGITGGLFFAALVLASHSKAAYDAVFLTDGVSYVVLAGLVARATSTSAGHVVMPAKKQVAPPAGSPIRNLRFMLFTISNGVLMLYDTAITVLLSIWLVQRTELPTALLPVLLGFNTVLTVILQVSLSRRVSGAPASLRVIPWTAALMVAACGLFATAESVPVWASAAAALTAVIALTFAENLHSVASWELSYAMAPAAARAHYLGAFSMGVTAQKIVGPTLLVTMLLPLRAGGWAILASLFALASIAALWSARAALTALGDRATRATTGLKPTETTT